MTVNSYKRIILILVIALLLVCSAIVLLQKPSKNTSSNIELPQKETAQNIAVESAIVSNIAVVSEIPIESNFEESQNYIISNIAVVTTIPIREQYPYRFPMRGP